MKTADRLRYLEKNITSKNMVDVGYPVFLDNTPIKTGNARRHTSKNSSQILADYPYATRLDHGWSRQSPKGMVQPAIRAMRAYIQKIVGK
jgi:hypothetical protein